MQDQMLRRAHALPLEEESAVTLETTEARSIEPSAGFAHPAFRRFWPTLPANSVCDARLLQLLGDFVFLLDRSIPDLPKNLPYRNTGHFAETVNDANMTEVEFRNDGYEVKGGKPKLHSRQRSGFREGGKMAEIVQERVGPVASVTGPIYLLLFPIPIVCFLGALITDVVYSRSAELMWLHFSEWLVATGLLFGLLAAIALLVEFIASTSSRARIGWAHLILFYAALIIELCNAFVHSRDGFTAVVPTGLTLSAIGSILALAAVATLFFMPVPWRARREVRP